MRRADTFRLVGVFGIISGLVIAAELRPRPGPETYAELKVRAEALVAERSYQQAYQCYQQAEKLAPPEEARWVRFRLADTLWRAQAATQTADNTRLEQARRELAELVQAIGRAEDRDLVWAEAQESLGDFHWSRRQAANWHAGWNHYNPALDWWSWSSDAELARQRYLQIIRKAARAAWTEPRDYGWYGYHRENIPLDVLESAARIAAAPNDVAYAHYLIAMTLRNVPEWRPQQRVPAEFEAALAPGRDTDWYDDALYYYAEWLASSGPVSLVEGGFRSQPDYVKAVKLFRRLLAEFRQGETRHYDSAKGEITAITSPAVGVGVSNIFVPGSLIQFHANWLNVRQVTFSLYAVTLVEDTSFAKPGWEHGIDLAGRAKLKTWTRDTGDTGQHQPGGDTITLEEKLPPGAYVVEITGDGQSERDLILVTDIALVVKTSNRQALVYCCRADDGAPVANADIAVWEYREGDEWQAHKLTGRTGPDGLAVFALKFPHESRGLYAAALQGDRQAFCQSVAWGDDNARPSWRIYAFTDRPAYRPGDTVQWKFIARHYADGTYRTPAGQRIRYAINDARGAKVKEESVALNTFGSAWGELALTEKLPLGECQVQFFDGDEHIGSAVLFRLEEYKLPEFKVTIETPRDEQGQPRAFRVGDTVEGTVQAEYYFGGPVAQADVQVQIRQQPFRHSWRPPREFGWYYEGLDSWRDGYGDGQLIKQEALKTDAAGKVTFRFDTPKDMQQDYEYRIEARVTDSSRREIVAREPIRVTQQKYYVYLHPKGNIYRPQDRVQIDVKTLDANEKPQPVSGQIRITRERWTEIWLDPQGREVRGDDLRAIQSQTPIFPPAPKPGEWPWRPKFRGYEREEVLTQPVKTDAAGQAEFTFTPEREGYYRAAWTSVDEGYGWIRAESYVWVTTKDTPELGYRPGEVDIIVDKDTFRVGQTVPVMLTVPTNNRYVLFAVEADNLYSYQLVHVTGTARLLEVPITARHVPNIFLTAAMVSGRQVFNDTEEVVVPPAEQFLTVTVEPDRKVYEPREEGTLTIRTHDHTGRPVAAEVALSLSDESVLYIQQEYAGDPRRFYYGEKRYHMLELDSTFGAGAYINLVRDEQGAVVDERQALAQAWRQAGIVAGDSWSFEAWNAASVTAPVEQIAGAVGDVRLAREGISNRLTAVYAPRGAMEAPMFGGKFAVYRRQRESEIAHDLVDDLLPKAAVQVRTDFRATAFWQPDVLTDADGTASVKVTFPDSLTSWRATARAVTAGTQVGMAGESVRTRQPLIVRLQAPRFFLVGDRVTVSAILNNNTDEPMSVLPSLAAEGVRVEGWRKDGKWAGGDPEPVTVKPDAEQRIDWLVRIEQPGTAKLKVVGRGQRHADAMERAYPIYEHGIDKLIARSGKLRGDDATIRLSLPKERKPGSTSLSVQVTPSAAVTMLDALPYLVNYPYGCTEQTMSRFLPTAIVARTLKDLGLPRELVANKVFGGIEPDPENLRRLGERHLLELDEVARQGLERLYDFQHADGGWAWWKCNPADPSDHFMSAYVVWGLVLAGEAGLNVRADVLQRGVAYLEKELVETETQPDLQAWLLHALAVQHVATKAAAPTRFEQTAFDNLYKSRDRLNAYTRALLALCAHHYGQAEAAQVLVRNLENGVRIDEAPDTSVVMPAGQESHPAVIPTAHWGEDGIYYRWSDGGVEATAFALRALLAIEPNHRLVEPVMNWLVRNRRGAQWKSTRDTAIVVLALNEYLRASGELKPELEFELLVNGQSIVRRQIKAEEALSAPSRFAIDPELIRDENDIRIRRTAGGGPLYFAAEARFVSREEPVAPAGHELFVRRQYYKLVPRPTLLKGLTYQKIPLNDGDSVRSGERIETVVLIEAKNNYEYLVFEDLKPAGFEAVQVRSGEPFFTRELKSSAVDRQLGMQTTAARSADEHMTRDPADYTGRTRWVHQELRDRKVALFVDRLATGVWEMRYELRAEVPGEFHALPALGYGMYVPEIRCNGAEIRVSVTDAD